MDLQDSSDIRPLGLLGGGSHFDDIMGGRHAANHTNHSNQEQGTKVLPRAMMVDHVAKQDIHCPTTNCQLISSSSKASLGILTQ
jgi:hypothetical protein